MPSRIVKRKSSAKTSTPAKSSARKTVRKTSASRSKKVLPETIELRISEKAYELFERRGYVHGYDGADWAAANSYVNMEADILKSRRKTPNKKILDRLEDEISKKAYQLYEGRGYSDGNDALDWYLAKELVGLENNLQLD